MKNKMMQKFNPKIWREFYKNWRKYYDPVLEDRVERFTREVDCRIKNSLSNGNFNCRFSKEEVWELIGQPNCSLGQDVLMKSAEYFDNYIAYQFENDGHLCVYIKRDYVAQIQRP